MKKWLIFVGVLAFGINMNTVVAKELDAEVIYNRLVELFSVSDTTMTNCFSDSLLGQYDHERFEFIASDSKCSLFPDNSSSSYGAYFQIDKDTIIFNGTRPSFVWENDISTTQVYIQNVRMSHLFFINLLMDTLNSLGYEVGNFDMNSTDFYIYNMRRDSFPVNDLNSGQVVFVPYDSIVSFVIRPDKDIKKYEILSVEKNSFSLNYNFLTRYISDFDGYNGYYLYNSTSGKYEEIGNYKETLNVQDLEPETTYSLAIFDGVYSFVDFSDPDEVKDNATKMIEIKTSSDSSNEEPEPPGDDDKPTIDDNPPDDSNVGSDNKEQDINSDDVKKDDVKEEVPENPKTGASLSIILVVLLVSISYLLVHFSKKKAKFYKI